MAAQGNPIAEVPSALSVNKLIGLKLIGGKWQLVQIDQALITTGSAEADVNALAERVEDIEGGAGPAAAVYGKIGTEVASGARAGVKGADIASAATTNLATATGDYVNVTGTTTIAALGTAAAGIERTVVFAAALTLTHDAASLILPTGADILTAAGDVVTFRSLGAGNWRCVMYLRAGGQMLYEPSEAEAEAGTSSRAISIRRARYAIPLWFPTLNAEVLDPLSGYVQAWTDIISRLSPVRIATTGRFEADLAKFGPQSIDVNSLADDLRRNAIAQPADVARALPDVWRQRAGEVGLVTATKDGSLFVPFAAQPAYHLRGPNGSGVSLDVRRSARLRILGQARIGTFDPGAWPSTTSKGTVVGPAVSTPSGSFTAGDYYEYANGTNADGTFAASTIYPGDLIVYGSDAAWHIQRCPGSASAASALPQTSRTWWEVTAAGTFKGTSYAIGDRIMFVGQQKRGGLAQPLLWYRGNLADTLKGDLWYAGEIDFAAQVSWAPAVGLVYQSTTAATAENRALYSENVAAAAWVMTNSTPTGPDTITDSGAGSVQHGWYQALSVTSGDVWWFEGEFQAGTHTVIQLSGGGTPFGTSAYCNVDLSTGTVTASSGLVGTPTPVSLGGGWWRIRIGLTAIATSAGAAFVVFGVNNNGAATRGPAYVSSGLTYKARKLRAAKTTMAGPYMLTTDQPRYLTVAAGDYVVSDPLGLSVVTNQPVTVVPNGGSISLSTIGGDASEWEVRRTDKAATATPLRLRTQVQTKPKRGNDKVWLLSDSMYDVGGIGNAIISALNGRSASLTPYGGATSRQVVAMLENFIATGDARAGDFILAWYGQNSQPGAGLTDLNAASLRQLVWDAFNLAGPIGVKLIQLSILGQRTATWDGTRIVVAQQEQQRLLSGALYDYRAWLDNNLAGMCLHPIDILLSGATTAPDPTHPVDPSTPGSSLMTEREVAGKWGIIPWSFHGSAGLPMPVGDLVYKGAWTGATLPTGGSNNDYYLRTDGSGKGCGAIIAKSGGSWAEYQIDTTHLSAAAAPVMATGGPGYDLGVGYTPIAAHPGVAGTLNNNLI